VGSWKGNKKHGYGRIETDTFTYEGDWKNDRRDGNYGVLWVRPKKHKIVGKRKKKKKKKAKRVESDEIYRKKFKRVYKGSWKNGKKDGRGIFFYENGEIYDGNWKNDFRSGYGIMYKLDGSKYMGYYKKNLRNGFGIILYKREIKDENKTKFSEFESESGGKEGIIGGGDIFQGYFLKGEKHGPGIHIYRDSMQIYRGEWSNGNPKCGELIQLDRNENRKNDDTKNEYVDLNNLPLPEIELLDSSSVLEDRILNIRKQTVLKVDSNDPKSDESKKEKLLHVLNYEIDIKFNETDFKTYFQLLERYK